MNDRGRQDQPSGMARFEEYQPLIARRAASFAAADLVVRPAIAADIPEVAELQAARDGGSAREHATHLAAWLATHVDGGAGQLLVATVRDHLVGFGKVRHFVAANDAPPNVAPDGWYLSGLVVAPPFRRQGLGHRLTQERLDWIASRSRVAHYVANARNRASIDLHHRLGFTELTRDFVYPGIQFDGGVGILFRATLRDA